MKFGKASYSPINPWQLLVPSKLNLTGHFQKDMSSKDGFCPLNTQSYAQLLMDFVVAGSTSPMFLARPMTWRCCDS